jgi:hypothetical protein
LTLSLPALARPGTVRTVDGRTWSGDVQPGPLGGLVVQLPDNTTVPVAVNELATAQLPLVTNVPTRLVWLRNGTVLAVDSLEADESAVRFVMRQDKLRVSLIEVAALVFAPLDLSPWLGLRRGAVLANGDFLDGELRGLSPPRARLSTPLFGVRQLEIGRECAALILHAPTPLPARWEIRTVQGSRWRANQPPVFLPESVRVVDLQLGEQRLPFAEIVEITARGGR